mgnify:CR=1 FL=1
MYYKRMFLDGHGFTKHTTYITTLTFPGNIDIFFFVSKVKNIINLAKKNQKTPQNQEIPSPLSPDWGVYLGCLSSDRMLAWS